MPTALITGVSRGFGRSLAEALARRGWGLIIDARNPAALEDAAQTLRRHATVRAVAGDVTDPAHRAALAGAAAEAGGVDLVVHNASTLGASPLPVLDQLEPEILERIYAVNLFAPIALTRALASALARAATIVAITSDAAVEPYEGWGGYGGSKAALEHTFAIWAAERSDLTVLVVDPGDMRTRMQQDAFPGEDIADRPLPEARVPALLALLDRRAPSGRYQLVDVPAGVS